MRIEKSKSAYIALGAAGLLIGVAAIQELTKPKGKRDLHGQILGFVPYDFRPPTATRVRKSFWNPRDKRMLTPRAFGVGWGVNVARIVKR